VVERCTICLSTLDDESSAASGVHSKCARLLFGTSTVPTIELDPEQLYLFGQQMAGRTTLSGVQSKVSLGWHQKTLRVRAPIGAYILKPQGSTYPELPQNEHVCMRIAELAAVEIAKCGLVRLSNDSLALIVARFDRERERRIPMEDFCQLSQKLPREKYDGSAELCARIVRRYAAEPRIDAQRLFRQFLVSWWIGNGDLHLKNLALLSRDPLRPKLSPAYDLLSTHLVIADDPLALPLRGKRSNLDRSDWLAFADYCELPPKLANIELNRIASALPGALELVEVSHLRPEFRAALADLLVTRARVIAE
jgi:serine/threonine-protein kinase HipA